MKNLYIFIVSSILIAPNYLVASDGISTKDSFYANIVEVILLNAQEQPGHSNDFSVENCSIVFNAKFFGNNGCIFFSEIWYQIFKDYNEWENRKTISSAKGIRYGTLGGEIDNGYHRHFANAVKSSQSDDEWLFVDASYSQFIDKFEELKLSPIFVGRKSQLVSLLKKYHSRIKISIGNYKTIGLIEDDVERFVENNWPSPDNSEIYPKQKSHSDYRNADEVIFDQKICSTLSNWLKTKKVWGQNIEVSCYENHVTFRGYVPNDEVRNGILAFSKLVPGVKRVTDNLIFYQCNI